MGRSGGGGCRLTSKVLRHIHAYYSEVLKQLPVEEFASLLSAGACFGLLDPVSNIIVNTTTAGIEDTTRSYSSSKNKRKRSQQMMEKMDRDKVLAQVARGIAKRSLDGLVTFLVCHFRCLHRWEALRYLRLAKADLLVAVRLIQLDRCVKSSTTDPSSTSFTTDPSSTSFKVALKCAAISAKHPCPASLTAIWFSLATSPPTDQQQQLQLSSHPRIRELLLALPLPAGLDHFHKSHQVKSLRQFHKQRSRDSAKEVPSGLAQSLVRLLLDMIHRVYLKAIARFPRGALRVSHHRGLLKAGHCFGPMDDPVSNILLNTIWYDTVFPPQEEFLADMLLTKSLARIQARSASGLINFLCTRFPELSRHDAIVFLLGANANLQEAISRAQCEGHEASGSLKEAYRVAALTAWHPDPEALAEFTLSIVPHTVLCHMRNSDRSLTAEEIEAISASLEAMPGSPSCSRQSMHQVPKLSARAADLVTRDQEKFKDDQFFFRGIVEAALKSMEPGYQLHVICGVNEQVAENGKHGYYDLRDGHPYCHINFLARPRSSPSAAPMLFFAECSNDDEGTEVSSCCVVDPLRDDGRCFHCEQQGTKIVHPSYVRYRGCDTDFEEMARGKGSTITNEELISCGTGRTKVSWLPEEDSVYFDPRWDTEIAELVNQVDEKKDAKLIDTDWVV